MTHFYLLQDVISLLTFFLFYSYNQSTDFIGEELSLNPLKLDELSKSAVGPSSEEQLQVSTVVAQSEKNNQVLVDQLMIKSLDFSIIG